MKPDSPILLVRELMMEFAQNTGLSSAGLVSSPNEPRRYLWTDSFAVCNFLELYRRTGDDQFLQLALRLVDQVHDILGRHRDDGSHRYEWISGLSEQEGRRHPTAGGLRIGKELDERRPGDPFDEQLEWDRDGQYYHYLTKWMHALNRVSRVTGDHIYNRWAVELAKTAHEKFTYVTSSGGAKRMYWKMSIDLSRPLIMSMGHHDPLDGYIAYLQLQSAAPGDPERSLQYDLSTEIADMAGICKGKSWVTDDPLGVGEILSNALKLAQMTAGRHSEQSKLLDDLMDASVVGLESFMKGNPLRYPAEYRLAFRELGLSIGLRAVGKMQDLIGKSQSKNYPKLIENLLRFIRIGDEIEKFWLDPAKRRAGSWIEHRDINMVMLATSLAPDGYLSL